MYQMMHLQKSIASSPSKLPKISSESNCLGYAFVHYTCISPFILFCLQGLRIMAVEIFLWDPVELAPVTFILFWDPGGLGSSTRMLSRRMLRILDPKFWVHRGFQEILGPDYFFFAVVFWVLDTKFLLCCRLLEILNVD